MKLLSNKERMEMLCLLLNQVNMIVTKLLMVKINILKLTNMVMPLENWHLCIMLRELLLLKLNHQEHFIL